MATDTSDADARAEAPRTVSRSSNRPPGHLWQTPAWAGVKRGADKVLLAAVCFCLAWAATNGVYLITRAIADRSIISVHMGSGPAVAVSIPPAEKKPSPLLRLTRLTGDQTDTVTIALANDGPDGIRIGGGTLTGPYLTGPAQLTPVGNGFVGTGAEIKLTGIVTVDCTAAAPIATAVIELRLPNAGQPTVVTFTATDGDHITHRETLVVDTTGYALQGQVCTR